MATDANNSTMYYILQHPLLKQFMYYLNYNNTTKHIAFQYYHTTQISAA